MFENVVEVVRLRKEFGKTVAVNDVSFSVAPGEVLGFLGANGAGKTTTIHMLLGLTIPDSGSIRIFGKDLESNRIEILRRCNFASAYVSLQYNLRVWENLWVFAQIYGVRRRRERIEELLELFEMHHMRNQLSGTLSAGEQTRLNLCKALLNDPDLLLLDEPTASLDPDQADKVRGVLRQLQHKRGMTIINTSHNMLDVHRMCDRIVFMKRGCVIAEGPVDEILRRFESASMEEAFITMART